MKRRRLLLAAAFSAMELQAPAAEANEARSSRAEAIPPIVVIGSGGAGLAAAVSALEAGAPQAVVFEKGPSAGGRTIFSMGQIAAAVPERTTPAGVIYDSPELMAAQMRAYGGPACDPTLADTLARESINAVGWLGRLGVRWRSSASLWGGRWPRGFSAYPMRSGYEYVKVLLLALQRAGERAELHLSTDVIELVMEGGACRGVRIRRPNGVEHTVPASAVIIATGGFAANADLVRRWVPAPESDAPKTFDRRGRLFDGADGSGILMAQRIGAALRGLENVLCVPYAGGKCVFRTGADIFLDARGRRFVNEDASFVKLRQAAAKLPNQTFWVVTDSQPFKGEYAEAKLIDGTLMTAGSVEDIARAMNLDAQSLAKELRRYNAFVRRGRDDDFDKPVLANTIERPPFFFGRERMGLHATLGGIAIDAQARVLDRLGRPIPNLYAAGECTGGIHGREALGGALLTSAFVFGRIAGRSAAADALA